MLQDTNLYCIAVSGQSVSNDLLAFCLIPVTTLLVKLLNFHTALCQSFDGVLCSVFCVNILRIAHYHNVANLAVAVEVTLVVCSQNDLALVFTGLSSICAYVCSCDTVSCPSVFLCCIRLTVDEYYRDVCCCTLVSYLLSCRRLYQVDDQDVNTLCDEVLDLVGLLCLVVLSVHNSYSQRRLLPDISEARFCKGS